MRFGRHLVLSSSIRASSAIKSRSQGLSSYRTRLGFCRIRTFCFAEIAVNDTMLLKWCYSPLAGNGIGDFSSRVFMRKCGNS